MVLKQTVGIFMKAEDCRVKAVEINKHTREIAKEIKFAQRTGDVSKVDLRWAKLFESFFVRRLPLESLDPFLDHLSELFPSIREKFELGNKFAELLIGKLHHETPMLFPKNTQSVRTALQLPHGGYPTDLAKALGNAVLH